MIAQPFANNGARVYVASHRADTLRNAVDTWGSSLLHPKGKLISTQVDITDKSSIRNLVKEVSSREKWVDVLVNDAGISESTNNVEAGDESAEKLSETLFSDEQATWENTHRTNVIGHFFMSSRVRAAALRCRHVQAGAHGRDHQHGQHFRPHPLVAASPQIQRVQGRDAAAQHAPRAGISSTRRQRARQRDQPCHLPEQDDGWCFVCPLLLTEPCADSTEVADSSDDKNK
ncbi:hypothetical protein PUNSTDRAFT_119862 [Punctularia strigosozonata HHB-11173 SS5]|uniref:uncharacterized protein n=1 Tax=Punctularia strigosozonata (strain HHB-11173) TaxID=741275 RepID=UPI00044166BE|nr:uncharacterized protein PUNSTDRAFT_119862 [Punctularia strigosozonata HHB-11173 SS5]EIN11064.1 hypothetical protein PUNSTDRAFT_119862 [Punctularia strigosozonata HHB-11173 SS5]